MGHLDFWLQLLRPPNCKLARKNKSLVLNYLLKRVAYIVWSVKPKFIHFVFNYLYSITELKWVYLKWFCRYLLLRCKGISVLDMA